MRTIIALLALASLLPAQNPVYANGNRVKLSRLNNRHALPARGLEALWIPGVRNLLKYPGDLTKWSIYRDGTATVNTVTFSADYADSLIYQAIPAGNYIASISVSSATSKSFRLRVGTGQTSGDLETSPTPATFTWVLPAGATEFNICNESGAGAGTITVHWVQLNAGSTALPYDGNTDDPSLATFKDLSGNGYALTLGTGSNAPSVGSSVGSGATFLSFGGVDDYATVAAGNHLLDNPTAFTLGAIVKPTVGAALTLLDNHWGYDTNTSLRWDITSAGTLRLETYDGDVAFVATTATLSSATWAAAAARYDGASLRNAINGVFDPATTAQSGALNGSAVEFSLGRYASLNGQYFSGSIAAVPIWSCALTAAEVSRTCRYFRDKVMPNLGLTCN